MAEPRERIAREHPGVAAQAKTVLSFAEAHRALEAVSAAEPSPLMGTAEDIATARAIIAESAKEARERLTVRDLAIAVREKQLTLAEANTLERAYRSYERGRGRERG